MAKNNDKGKLLEKIVASFHNDKNLKVEMNKKIKGREIDVLISTVIAGYQEIFIPIECKNRSKPIKAEMIDAYVGKLNQIGLSTQNAIFVSTNGYESGAYSSAKYYGIKLLELEGLNDDRLSELFYEAIQSIFYVLPLYVNHSFLSSNDRPTLFFLDKNSNKQLHLFDFAYKLWNDFNLEKNLGLITLNTGKLDNIYCINTDGKLSKCDEIIVTFKLVCYVFSFKGNAKHLKLIDSNSNQIERENINASFGKKFDISLFENSEELDLFINDRNEKLKLNTKYLKFPKIRVRNIFYPFSEKVQSMVSKFGDDYITIEEKIKNIEENIFNVFDK